MEKFSNWRDKGTGISPFMPPVSEKSFLTNNVIAPLLVILKLPFLIALYLAVYVVPKPAVELALTRLMGVGDIDLLVEGIRKTKMAEIERYKPSTNDIVLVNLISPIDVFVLFVTSRVNSLNQIRVIIPRQGVLHVFSVWKYVSFMFGELSESLSEETRLTSYDELKGKLVFLFPEGTSTNNKAILPFEKIPDAFFLIPDFKYKTVVLRMYSNSLTLPVPNLTPVQYLRKILSQSKKTYIKVKVVPTEKCSLSLIKAIFAENGLSTVGLTLRDKRDFYKYFTDYAVSEFTK